MEDTIHILFDLGEEPSEEDTGAFEERNEDRESLFPHSELEMTYQLWERLGKPSSIDVALTAVL